MLFQRSHEVVSALQRAGLELRETPEGLVLAGDGMELCADFSSMVKRIQPSNVQRELLVRAAKVKGAGEHPLVVDATAGLGEDSLLLAAAGFRVWLFERDAVISALLRDALERAAAIPEFAEPVSRMQLFESDSVEALAHLPEKPDVVLLDPMFPERTKSASVKKKFQLLHKLERPCADEEALLQAAIGAAPRKVVIKRPPKGPYLAGRKPDYSLTGKAVRYDVLAFAR